MPETRRAAAPTRSGVGQFREALGRQPEAPAATLTTYSTTGRGVATACGKTDHKLDDEPRSFVVHLRLTGNSRPNEFATPSCLPVNVPARSSKTASAALAA